MKKNDHRISPPPNFTNWPKIIPGASSKCRFPRPYLQRSCFSKSKVRPWNYIINQHPVLPDAGEVRIFSLMLFITQTAGLLRAPLCRGTYISCFSLTVIPRQAGCYDLILWSEKERKQFYEAPCLPSAGVGTCDFQLASPSASAQLLHTTQTQGHLLDFRLVLPVWKLLRVKILMRNNAILHTTGETEHRLQLWAEMELWSCKSTHPTQISSIKQAL